MPRVIQRLSSFLTRSSGNVSALRKFSNASPLESGHSKWATIKHDKARNDAVKNKQRTILSKDITLASKYGGPNPDENPKLALALANAKRAGFPKASIETAIARGQGRSTSGAALEYLTLEAVVPPVGLIFECQTESKNRALQEIRLIVKDHGGAHTQTAYLFEKLGRITFDAKEGFGADNLLELALNAGAIDIAELDDGRIVVDTDPTAIKAAERSLTDATGLQVHDSELIWVPKEQTVVESVDDTILAELAKLYEALKEYPGVDEIYVNLGGRVQGRLSSLDDS